MPRWPVFVKDKTHWYDDGDVVIEVVAPSKTPRRFRVHKLILTLSSKYFQNMFKKESNWAESSQQSLDSGAKPIQIHEIDPDDFGLFLDWAYPFENNDLTNASEVATMIHLSDRLICEHFKEIAENAIHDLEPSMDLLITTIKYRVNVQVARKMLAWLLTKDELLWSGRLAELDHKTQAYIFQLALAKKSASAPHQYCYQCRLGSFGPFSESFLSAGIQLGPDCNCAQRKLRSMLVSLVPFTFEKISS